MAKVFGSAFNRNETYHYTWWIDGRVTRRRVKQVGFRQRAYVFGAEEQVIPPVPYNHMEFCDFAPFVESPTIGLTKDQEAKLDVVIRCAKETGHEVQVWRQENEKHCLLVTCAGQVCSVIRAFIKPISEDFFIEKQNEIIAYVKEFHGGSDASI